MNLQEHLPPSWRSMFDRRTAKDDAVAGQPVGVETVPDGLAAGLLAGVNPLAGLYGYLFGTLGGALVTSTPFMAVQATGAMALVVADTDLAARDDPERALFTLAVLTGAVMIAAGVLRLGSLVRFVPSAVMVGFITAVGVNIVLVQLENFTGYDSDAEHRVTRAIDLVFHFWQVEWASVFVGVSTIVLIVVLQRTRLRAMGMVAAIVITSAIAAAMNWNDELVPIVRDLADLPNALPGVRLPVLGDVLALLLPAVALAVVLYVVDESNNLKMKRIVFEADGRRRETDPPARIGRHEVVVVQPYGSLFFASAPVFEGQLPTVDGGTWGSVVVVRLRGVEQLGLSLVEVFRRYAQQLRAADSRLKIVIASETVVEQFRLAGIDTDIAADDVYLGTEWLGETVRQAYDDACAWVAQH